MTQSELLSRIKDASNLITKGSMRGSANYVITSRQFYDYFNNTKSQLRMEKINRILNNE